MLQPMILLKTIIQTLAHQILLRIFQIIRLNKIKVILLILPKIKIPQRFLKIKQKNLHRAHKILLLQRTTRLYNKTKRLWTQIRASKITAKTKTKQQMNSHLIPITASLLDLYSQLQ